MFDKEEAKGKGVLYGGCDKLVRDEPFVVLLKIANES
jgi:hypothetical protein